MSDMNDDPLLQMPPVGGGSEGTQGVWADIDRSYDTEFRHHLRTSRLHQRNNSFNAQQFQSQLLGMMLLSESEAPLVGSGDAQPPPADPPADPTPQQ